MTPMDAHAFLSLLKDYSRLEVRTPHDERERADLRQAILWLVGESETENLGICASDQTTAVTALQQYLQGLDYQGAIALEPEKTIMGPVYLKCNTHSLRYYLDSYEGDYRGVLLACQTEDGSLAGTYGYFPLDLFAG